MNKQVEYNIDLLNGIDDCKKKIINWLTDVSIDEQDKTEIHQLIEAKNTSELRDRFYTDLEFGTGGLRGIMGEGFNRLNKYIVRRAIQGFANYILKCGDIQRKKGIAIAYDSRNNSSFFALEAASVLCGNNIPVFLYPTLQTTPALSYAIRKLNCTGGLCITASHNPPQYNGLKVYWEDGAQIISPQDTGILKEVYSVSQFSDVKLISIQQARIEKLLQDIPSSVLDSYYEEIKTLELLPEMSRNNLKIVYTPLHGTGKIPALRALKSWGFEDVFVVPEQAEPNGNFPTVKKPNPEEKEALSLAISHGNERKADVIFATDPDSDRLAVAVYSPHMAQGIFKSQSVDNYVLLNGNQTGALLLNHILKYKQKNKSLKKEHKVVKTIVTSELHERICTHYGVEFFNTLTGFKWIAGLVRSWEETHQDYEYLFGTEESFGFMTGNFVRDKDAISALCLAAEMAADYKNQQKNLCDGLLDLFETYGAWQEELINVELYGEAGLKRIQALMAKMRTEPILFWNGSKVVEIRDFTDPLVQAKFQIPASNVLQFFLEDGSKISMRPSGTEPKLKYYISTHTKDADISVAYKKSLEKIENLKNEISLFVERT